MGVVEFGTGARSTTNSLAISLAGAIRLPSRHRRFPLHRAHARALDRVVVDQVFSRNENLDGRHGESARWRIDLADAERRRPRSWNVRARLAGDF